MDDDSQPRFGPLTPAVTVTFLAKRFICDRKTMAGNLKDGEVPGAVEIGSRWQIPLNRLPGPIPPEWFADE